MELVKSVSIFACLAIYLIDLHQVQAAVVRRRSADVHEASTVEKSTDIVAKSSADIVIGSLDEKPANHRLSHDRHHYEGALDGETTLIFSGKPEPRNQQEEPPIVHEVLSSSTTDLAINQDFNFQRQHQQQNQQQQTSQQLQSQDQVAIGQTVNSQSLFATSTSSPLLSGNTTNSAQLYVPPLAPQVQPAAPSSWYQATASQQHAQQITTPVTTQQSIVSQPSQQLQVQPQQQQQLPTSTSQSVGTQHPNSINSIIASGQDTSSSLQTQIPMQHASSGGITQQAGQMVTVNGQPMLLVNPAQVQNGRRVSISSWLRGLSNMLANIFNRRDIHGSQMAASSNTGHWLQLGPGAPHWLTQAQTTIQQGQHQFQQQAHMLAGAANTRLASFLAPPQQIVSSQQIAQLPNFQQSQPDPIQGSAATNSASIITLPAPSNLQQPQMQQQQQQQQQAAQYQSPVSIPQTGSISNFQRQLQRHNQ